jgi:hypothetical protein
LMILGIVVSQDHFVDKTGHILCYSILIGRN